MDVEKLPERQRRIRTVIRDFLLVATLEELRQEKQISLDLNDTFRAECVQELIDEEKKNV